MDFPMLFQARSEIKNLMNDSDDLIVRARSGDDEAFGVIFEHHSRFIYKFIYAMIGDRSAAEELTQETFLAAYKSIHGLRGDAQLRTWLCGIAKNVVFKSLRSRRKEGMNSGEQIESLGAADDKNLPPDREVLSRELNHLIRSALARLDADKRLVFILKELQHLSYKEISDITGAAIPKLKTDLHRAKLEMRRALSPYLEAKR
ncbi:MAG: sigma-70 family RNA polymerase sigma factor [Acidobacteria bacterium]|nr:sigma-70 family RNA polymerase sigma factor [Acidobacteriota bacterium]